MLTNPISYYHNLHLDDVENFYLQDPNLKKLNKCIFQFRSNLLDKMLQIKPGIFSLTGGRQIGKTTFLKQLMKELLKNGTNPQDIFFLTGEIISDYHTLISTINQIIEKMSSSNNNRYLIIDEVTYIKEWDKGIKFLADAGRLENIILIITGSDSILIQDARTRFPGRRGINEEVDFHYSPLSFKEVIDLKYPNGVDSFSQEEWIQQFNLYLQHGGYLTAINDMATHSKILPATFQTYSDWIRGDFLKKNKQEYYLTSVLGAILKRYGCQITWNALARDLPIDHPATIIDYVHLLNRSDVCHVVDALIEDKLIAAPKKAKKIYFNDPFILQAIARWIGEENLIDQDEFRGAVVEGIVHAHYKKFYPTFYIKSEGEVDLAYIKNKTFVPVEIKWSKQIRSKDLKQIRKYPNGIILCRHSNDDTIPPSKFLPLELYNLRS